MQNQAPMDYSSWQAGYEAALRGVGHPRRCSMQYTLGWCKGRDERERKIANQQ